MKRNLFLLCLVAMFAIIPASARVSTEQATDAEYLMNEGYSQVTAEDVFILKNRANGKPVEPLYRRDQNALVRGWKAFWGYVDPARDEFDRIHHDIKLSPAFSDL